MAPEEVEQLLGRVATRAAEEAARRAIDAAPTREVAPTSWIDTSLGKIASAIIVAGFLAAATGSLLVWRDVAVATTERIAMGKQIDRIEEDVAELVGRQHSPRRRNEP